VIKIQTNPVKAIREYCLKCCLESSNEVKLCSSDGCPLYAFRFGKNPYRKKRELTEEQKKEISERLRKPN